MLPGGLQPGPFPPIAGASTSAVLPSAGKAPQLHLALSSVLSALAGDKKLGIVGDSISAGYNGPNGIGYSAAIAEQMVAAGIPSALGLAVPTNPNAPAADARWAVGSGWALGAVGQHGIWGGNGTAYVGNSGAAGNLVFTPTAGATYDTYDIYYLTAPSFGAFHGQIAGGASTPINTAVANGIGKTTVTGTAALNAALTLSGITVAQIAIIGVEPSLSTLAKLRIGNAGVNGASTADWVNTAAGAGFGPLDAIKKYAANVWIIMLGGNDLNQGLTWAQTSANLTTIAAACKAAPADVIIASWNPSQQAGVALGEPGFMANLATFAGANGFPYIDLWDSWGGIAAYNELQPLGYYLDTAHATPLGYTDIGRVIADSLVSI